MGMERTRTEPEPWRIVDRADGRGKEQGMSVSNIEHLAGMMVRVTGLIVMVRQKDDIIMGSINKK